MFVCSDTTVAGLYADTVLRSLEGAGIQTVLHTFPPGDESKSLEQLNLIYEGLGKARLSRDGVLLALGGGVVSDLTGFAAATWMRGVRYVTCPTTLEADVDASIGGKTAINHPAGKNLVGAFHHAELVAVDTKCLQTLPARDVASGLAESIKHALICDEGLLTWHEEQAEKINAVDADVMADLVDRNLRIKAGVVESDEREHGRRAILNFGHTIGHAVESWFDYQLRHGEGVGLGMVAAAHISRELGLLDQFEVERICAVLKLFDLPIVTPKPLDIEAVSALTFGDKKVLKGKRRWVLLDGLGKTVIRDDVEESLIREAISAISP